MSASFTLAPANPDPQQLEIPDIEKFRAQNLPNSSVLFITHKSN